MRKVFRLEDLDCANCAAKMERAINNIAGVKFCSVSFMNQKMTLEIEDADFNLVLKEVEKTMKKVEPDCRIVK